MILCACAGRSESVHFAQVRRPFCTNVAQTCFERTELEEARITPKKTKIADSFLLKKGKRKVQGVPQSQTAALPRPQEEEETDKSKQAQIDKY